MKIYKVLLRSVGVLLFVTGVALGLVLSTMAVWGEVEAMMFDLSRDADAGLGSLRCPLIVTTKDTAMATASVKNPTDKKMTRSLKVHISHGHVTLMREINEKLPLEPGEKVQLEWALYPDDAAFGRFILVGAYMPSYYPYPSRRGTCASLVLDTPYLTGGQLAALAIAGSGLGMVSGLGLWVAADRPSNEKRRKATGAMATLAGTIAAGIVVNLLGWWLLGGILLVITVIVIAELVRHFFLSR
jgi:hypothetical protein